MTSELNSYVEEQIWICEYPVHYSGLDFSARMSVIKLENGSVMLHSPCKIDGELKAAIESIGPVSCIVAPGSYHYFHIPSAQAAFPDAQTFICPGVETKLPDLKFDWVLGDRAPDLWSNEFEQVLVRGAKYMCEVAFYHVPSKTLLLVDLVENIGDDSKDVGLGLKIWWKAIFHMWNQAKPAPEYQLGWKDKRSAAMSLNRILEWEISRVVLAHGELIDTNVDAILRKAWDNPLNFDGRSKPVAEI